MLPFLATCHASSRSGSSWSAAEGDWLAGEADPAAGGSADGVVPAANGSADAVVPAAGGSADGVGPASTPPRSKTGLCRCPGMDGGSAARGLGPKPGMVVTRQSWMIRNGMMRLWTAVRWSEGNMCSTAARGHQAAQPAERSRQPARTESVPLRLSPSTNATDNQSRNRTLYCAKAMSLPDRGKSILILASHGPGIQPIDPRENERVPERSLTAQNSRRPNARVLKFRISMPMPALGKLCHA